MNINNYINLKQLKKENIMVYNENVRTGLMFEDLCIELFKKYDLSLNENSKFGDYNADIDFLDSNSNRYIAEVKLYRISKVTKSGISKAIDQLNRHSTLTKENVKKILIIGSPTNDYIRNFVETENNIALIDYSNLLYIAQIDDDLYNKFYQIMSTSLYDIENIKLQAPTMYETLFSTQINIAKNKKSSVTKNDIYINELKKLPCGHNDYKNHEILCEKILKQLFRKHLSNWNTQSRTDDGLNRMDLVCRINKGNPFWDFIIESFDSRYMIFEFKNYCDLVKQTQIYTTEKYLYQTALRKVCFLISRNGLDDNAHKATKGIMRESGKMIISL